jgi:hypothetical protein
MISKFIQQILEKYNMAQKQNFTGHPIATIIRHDFPDYLENLVDTPNDYIFVGSPGRGMWTFSPWIGVLDKKVTSSVQRGYYIVYLFREDMKGVYLSLNQGMRKILEKNSEEKTNEILKLRANEFRNKLQYKPKKELLEDIDLGVIKSSYGPYYESGNIFAKYYPLTKIPSEDILIEDFNLFLDLYHMLANNQISNKEQLK